MKRYTAAVIAILLLCSAAGSVLYSQGFDGLKLSRSANGYEIEYSLPGYNTETVTRLGEQYDIISMNNYGITPEEGLPMLPQLTFILVINKAESSPGFIVQNQFVEEKFQQRKIFPTQAPWEKSGQLKDRPFTVNKDYYSTSGSIFNPLVKISEPIVIAGVKAVMVTIYPFRYDPTNGKLLVTRSAEINIDLPAGMPAYNSIGSSFREMFDASVINPGCISYTNTNNYLIITPPEYEAAMGPFASYKSSMGYNVLMVNTGTTGTTTAAILNYIQQRYNNISTRPEFILLAGDINMVPEWTGIGSDNPHTDLNYTLLEGSDAFADAFIGRFSVSSTAELTNIINKTIYMESSIGALPKKNVWMASTDNHAITEGTHNFVIDSFFTSPPYSNVKLYTYTNGSTTQQLIDALNANQVFAVYSGHGSTTSWADGPPLSQSQVNSLTNTYFPFVYSFACLTGQYQNTECFGETWIRRAKGGSVFWGSSVNSFWDEDDILERRLFRAMFTDGLKKTAPMFVQAKTYLVLHYGSVTTTMRRYLEMYNCLGDPSLYEAPYGPVISHVCLPNTENLAGPYTVNCMITPAGSNIDPAKTKLFWTRGSSFSDSISLTNSAGNNWTANIPGNGSAAIYKYYLKTCDMAGRITVLPPDAPTGYFTFSASVDATAPVITHTQLGNTGQPMWPATVNSNVTDNIGVDSVWVEWFKNTPSVIKRFRLNVTSGSNFAGVFNSANPEVAPGDSIFYVIKAVDNSSNHNIGSLPAAGYYKFLITDQAAATFCKQTFVPIRDNQISYDTLYIASYGTIVDFNFKMESLVHTYDGDITFSVTSPAGLEVVLSNRRGSGGDNYTNTLFDDSAAVSISTGTAPFTGSFTPETPLNVYNGAEVHGNWIFKVNDQAGGDTGHVERYCLNIIYNAILALNNNQLPVKFELGQNYPNPFNPVTTIKYSVPKQSIVRLVIYDIIGREVKTLVNEMRAAGTYEAVFDASQIASGVYFYRMESGDFTDVKKLVILK
ncbi:MAG: T9SS type A sorting domain-containing protein [Ignavibacteria bacterium]|mgnify:CR=1 FL=1|nr:T9SS type A sorting domain-containing protein [Ignavibacteria bacterium]